MALTIVTLITFFVLALTLVMGLMHVPWHEIGDRWELSFWLIEIVALYGSLIFIIVKMFRSEPEQRMAADRAACSAGSKESPAHFPLRKPICNVTAAVQPFALFFLSIAYCYYRHVLHSSGSGWGAGLECFAVFIFIAIPLGLLLSVISLYRSERYPMLTLIELMVYTILAFLTRPLFC